MTIAPDALPALSPFSDKHIIFHFLIVADPVLSIPKVLFTEKCR